MFSESGLIALAGSFITAMYSVCAGPRGLTYYSQGKAPLAEVSAAAEAPPAEASATAEAVRAEAFPAAEASAKTLQAMLNVSAGLSQLLEITRNDALLNARMYRSSARGVELALCGMPWVQERPAFLWTAADVAAWFHASGWPQYEQHFSPYDGAALLTLNTEKQLVERGVLPEHAGRLLAAMRLLI